MAAVAATGTVYVESGTYTLTGDITLNKSLTIDSPNDAISPVTNLG